MRLKKKLPPVWAGAGGWQTPPPLRDFEFETHPQHTRPGRMQVNTALYTCVSWYAYAAMFGSSIEVHHPGRGGGAAIAHPPPGARSCSSCVPSPWSLGG